MNSRMKRQLRTLEDRLDSESGLVLLVASEWQVLLDQHGKDEYAARQAAGGTVLIVSTEADRGAFQACLNAVRCS